MSPYRHRDLRRRLADLEAFAAAHGYRPGMRVDRPKFTVKVYGSEDEPMNYKQRQDAANTDGAVCYVEHHFNSCDGLIPHYAVVIVASNASETSCQWGRLYTGKIVDEWPDLVEIGGDSGIKVGGYRGRGNANLKHTSMPAILVEPLFASNPSHSNIIIGQKHKLARILVESIRETFPDGGLVAFSVGHKYKVSKPLDRGCRVFGDGTEADNAEEVLRLAAEMLRGDA